MRKQRFLFLIALSASIMLPAGFAMAARPAPQGVLLKSVTVVNPSQLPRSPRPRMVVPIPHHYANPAMVGLIKAALAAGKSPAKSSGGKGHGGPPSGGGSGSGGGVTPQLPNLPGITLGTTAAGLGMIDGGGYEPPDTNIAAGLDQTGAEDLLEVVNLAAGVFTSSGTPLYPFPLTSFTPNTSTDSVSDPRVLYDPASHKWFISLTTFSPISDAGWDLAVSETSDPGGSWAVFYFPTASIRNPDGSVGNFPDFPKMGFTGDKLVLTGDAFSVVTKQHGPNAGSSYTYQGTEFLVINKTELVDAVNAMAGSTSPGLVCATFFPPDQGATAIEPAQNLAPASTTSDKLYMAAVDSNVASTSTLDVWTVTGNAVAGTSSCGGQASATLGQLPINTVSIPPNAQQEGSSTLLDTNDDNLLDAMYRPGTSTSPGSLWVSGNDACTPAGDNTTRSCARFIQVNVPSSGSMSVAQDFDLGSPGYYFYYPAVRTDAAGDMVAVFTGSSSTSFASVYAAMQKAGGAANELGYFQLVEPGSLQYTLSPPRWGDYSGASIDPNNNSVIWIAGEFSTDYSIFGSIWETWMASINPSQTP